MNVGHDVNLTDTDTLGARLPASERTRPAGGQRRGPPADGPGPQGAYTTAKLRFSMDAGSLLQPALRRWPWLFIGAALGLVIGFGIGSYLWKLTFTSVAQMVKYDPPVAQDAFRPRSVDVPTLIGRLEDPAFLRRVGQQLTPKMTSGEVLSHMRVAPERNSGIMNVVASGRDAGVTTNLANAFARETLKFTEELQAQDAAEAETYVAKDLAEAESQLAEAQKNMPALASGSADSERSLLAGSSEVDRNREEIQKAKDELTKLLSKYTDAHPLVRQQRATIAALEAESATGVNARDVAKAAANPTDAATKGPRVVTRDEFEISLFRVRQVESLRMQLAYRLQQIQLFKANPPRWLPHYRPRIR